MTFIPVRLALLLSAFLTGPFPAVVDAAEASTKDGKMSSVRLLPVSRLETKSGGGEAAPDGMMFHFVIARPPEAGPLALKETRDFLLGGESYQVKTKAELGKQFEPATVVSDAARFFDQHPQFVSFAPKSAASAKVISISIGGASLTAGANAEVTVQVGTGRQVEPFTFAAVVPGK